METRTVKCDGLTEISGGRNRKLNFTFNVDDTAIDTLLADALKVRYRAKYRKQTETMSDGDNVTVMVSTDGDKIVLRLVDEKAAKREQLMRIGMDETKSPEERIAALDAIKNL